MFKIKIADFIVEIHNKFNYVKKLCSDYIYKGSECSDFIIAINNEDLEEERRLSENKNLSIGYIESVCVYRKIALEIPLKDAMVMHGAAISVNDRGIIFIAPSGIGKTTHTLLWKKVFEDKLEIINGDKPIVKFIDGSPFVFGTPWAGKETLQKNGSARLTDVCLIFRGTDNSAQKVAPNAILKHLMRQVYLPNEPTAAMKTLNLIDQLTKTCNFWIIQCNMDLEAAQLASDIILNKEV